MIGLLLALTAFGAELTVTAEGAEPRTVYALSLAPETTQRVKIDTAMTTAVQMAGMDMPAMTVPDTSMVLAFQTGTRLPEGMPLTFEVADVDVAGEGPMRDALLAEMAKVEGTKGARVVAADGRWELSAAERATAESPTVASGRADLSRTLGDLSIRLPTTAIGLGATWKIEEDQVQGGVSMHQVTTWKLEEVRADGRLVLSSATVQSAEEQMIETPNGSAKLKAFATTGTGRTMVDLGRPVPVEATHAMETEMSFEVMGMSATQKMTMSSTQREVPE
jgi:hypothetical protein